MVALCATKTWNLELAGAGTTTTGTPAPGVTYFLGAEPEKEGGGEERGGRVCGSVCGKDFFFFLFSPFSYVKSARKLGSLSGTLSSVSPPGEGPRPGAPACHCWWPRIA